MPTEADCFDVLGVPRDADADQVKLAYRQAALSYHPDTYAGDRAEAERKLRELIEAYQTALGYLGQAAWSNPLPGRRAFTPQDFAREGFGQRAVLRVAEDNDARGDADRFAGLPISRRTYATRNETRTFVWLWLTAILLGIAVGGAVAWNRLGGSGGEQPQTADVVIAVLFGELMYAVLAAGTVVLIVLTRKIVRLTLQLASQRWRILPPPAKKGELPEPGPGGKLTVKEKGGTGR